MSRQKQNPPKRNKVKASKAKSYAAFSVIILLSIVLAAAVYYQVDPKDYLIAAASAAFTLFMAYTNQKPQERSIKSLLIPACAAVIPLLASSIYEKHNEIASKPLFAVKTIVGNDTVDIYLKTTSGEISSWVISYPKTV